MSTQQDVAQGDEDISTADVQTSGSTTRPSSYQNRISLACDSCRSRKTKCDGQQPTCSTCQQIQVPCVYRSTRRRTRRNSSSRAHLTQKIRDLESRLNTVSERRSSAAIASVSDALSPQASHVRPEQQTREQRDVGRLDQDTSPESSDEEATLDLRAARLFRDESASGFGYFGPSSNHAFFRAVSRSFAQVLRCSTSSQNRTPALSTTFSTTTTVPERQQGDLTATSQPRAPRESVQPAPLSITERRHLVDYFFATVGSTFAFITMSDLTSMLKETHSDRGTYPLRLNQAFMYVVFAHAYSALGDPRGEWYFQRSLKMLTPAKLREADLRSIQVLLLLANYQQNHQMSVESWTNHALTVKAALQLGLHSPLSYRELSSADAEMNFRLWYSIINQDRTLCMCIGRPCLIPPQYICTPPLQNPRLAYRSSTVAIHQQQIESLLHHGHLTGLYTIIASILSTLYEDNIERGEIPDVWVALNSRLLLLQRLEQWRCGLDQSLLLVDPSEPGNSSETTNASFRFRLSLSIHYYRASLLLNGSVMTNLLELVVNENLTGKQSTLLDQCIPLIKHELLALQNTHKVFCLVLRQGESFINQNNMWWTCSHTATMLAMHTFCLALLCHISPAITSSTGVSMMDVRRLLNESLTNMRLIQRTSALSSRAREVLEKFIRILDSIQPKDQAASSDRIESWGPQDLNLDAAMDRAAYGVQLSGDLLGQIDIEALLGESYLY